MALTAEQIAEARKEGYTDAEILQHYAATKGIDLKAARDEGYSDSEILSHFSGAEVEPQTQQAPRTESMLSSPELSGALGAGAGAVYSAKTLPVKAAKAFGTAVANRLPGVQPTVPTPSPSTYTTPAGINVEQTAGGLHPGAVGNAQFNVEQQQANQLRQNMPAGFEQRGTSRIMTPVDMQEPTAALGGGTPGRGGSILAQKRAEGWPIVRETTQAVKSAAPAIGGAAKNIMTSSPVAGAMAGYNLQDAMNRYRAGDTTGAAIGGVGALSQLLPRKGRAGLIKTGLGLGAAGINALRSEPQGYAGGGKADLLMEGLKATNTVRNFRKGGPSAEDLLDYYRRSNIGIKSGARRAREAQYVHDIVPTHMFGIPKQIGIQDLQREKAVLVPVAGDRTLTGHKLRAVDNVPLRNEVELEGGPFYGQKEFEQGRPGFWASNDATAQGFQNMLARGADRYGDRPFYGLYGAMDYDAGNFAKHNTRALYEQIDAMNPSRAQIKAFDKHMRQQYPDWVGIKDEESLNQLLGSVPMRKFFAETLNKPTKATEFGMPSGEATVHAITEPGLREVPVGNMGFTVGKLDPQAPITLEPTFNETYNRKIPGTPVGQMKAQLHWSDYFPDAHKEIMSNPRQAPSAWGTFKMGDYYQPVTQEMVDRIAPIEEAISKHSDIILPGQPGWFKKGGSTSMDYRSKLPKGGPFPWSAAPEFKSDLSPREMAEQAMRRKMLQMGRGMDTWKNTSTADKLSAAGSNIAAAAPEIAETAASFHPGYGLGYAGAAAYDYLRNGGDPISTGIDVAFNAPGVLGAVGKGVKAVAPYARTMGKVAMNEGAPYARRAAGMGGLGAIGVPTATASEGAREMSQGLGSIDDAYLQPELAQGMSDIQKPVNWPHMAIGGETAKFLKKAMGVGSRTIEGSPHTYPPIATGPWMRDYTPSTGAGLPTTREGWDALSAQHQALQNKVDYSMGRTGPTQPQAIQYMGKYRQGTPEERAAAKMAQEDAMRSVIESRKAQWLKRSREMGMSEEDIASEMNSPWGAPWMP